MSYPSDQAGYKGRADGPGADAARHVTKTLSARRAAVLKGVEQGPGTAEEIGARIGLHWYRVRPRLSDLKALGLVIETGERGPSAFGLTSGVWRCTTEDERSLFNARKAAADEKGEANV